MSAGPELARTIFTRWFNRRRPDPPRAVRIVLEVNGKPVIDISSRLALAMLDCNYGRMEPIDCVLDAPEGVPDHVVRLKFSEVE